MDRFSSILHGFEMLLLGKKDKQQLWFACFNDGGSAASHVVCADAEELV
jgi:hypothetical protein